MTSDQYQATFKDLVSKGFRLRQVSGYGVGNQDLYAAIWEKSGGPTWEAHHRMTSDQYQATFKDLVSKGFRLRQVSGYGVGNQDLYAAIWEKSGGPTWEAHHRMTSDQYQATFKDLVSKGFRLRQVSGYGVGNQDLYAAIWEKSGGPTWEAHHRMTSDQYQGQFEQLVGWVLDNRPLKNDPGKAYEYLNFGFCVLGRVIEKVSGKGYEDFVKQAVLSRCGISRMQIGAETQAAKAPHEVTYYGSSPYSLLTHRMDAHGGWIATPIDLLRLMVRVDGFTAKADILSPVDEASMDTGSSVKPGYALGWIIEPTDRAHNGAMDGTMGFLVRRNDGISYAVLVNTRPAGDSSAWGLKGVIDGFIGSVSSWPGYDLF